MIREVSFDQRIEKIGVATNAGFKIFEIAHHIILYEAHFPNGGAKHISILNDSNLVAACDDQNNVILWDIEHDNVMKQFSPFSESVEKLLFFSDCLLIVTECHAHFLNTCDFSEYACVDIPAHSACCISMVQSISQTIVILPSADGKCLKVADYHDPEYELGNFAIQVSDINMVQLDREGDFLAMATSGSRNVYLLNIKSLKLVASYKRGLKQSEINAICFDRFSNYFLLSTNTGTLHIFEVPIPGSNVKPLEQNRSKYSVSFKKGINSWCAFDVAGYLVFGITSTHNLIQLKMNTEKDTVDFIGDEIVLDI